MLFHKNPYLKEAESVVKEKKGNEFVFNKTIFYPGGGGQPCDTGYIIFNNEKINVIEVYEENGKVWHELEKPVEGTVKQVLNWERRYKLMKLHTGEHLFFGTLMKILPGIKISKIWLNEKNGKIFVSYNKTLTWEGIAKAEKIVNEKISIGLEVKEVILKKQDLKKYPHKPRIKLDKISDEDVRIIEIGDYDFAACCGIHVKNTNEIELFKVISINKKGEGYLVEFDVGYSLMPKLIKFANLGFVASGEVCTGEIKKLVPTIKNMKRELNELKEKNKELSRELLKRQEIKPEVINEINFYCKELPLRKEELVKYAQGLIKNKKTIAILFSGNFIICACSKEITINMVDIINKITEITGGGGGGKQNFATGSAKEKEKISKAIKNVKLYIK